MVKLKRMSLSAPLKLSDEQVDALSVAIDSFAAIAAFSGQEASLQLMVDGLEYEFGKPQAELIMRGAAKFREVLQGKDQPQPVAAPVPYGTQAMSLNRTNAQAAKKLTKPEISSAVRALNY